MKDCFVKCHRFFEYNNITKPMDNYSLSLPAHIYKKANGCAIYTLLDCSCCKCSIHSTFTIPAIVNNQLPLRYTSILLER